MALQKSMEFWTIFVLGLLYISIECDARAVNVSNTWTMPQEGLNVFYRFFRDRISWFEADAVCQFHHANLVTVDNSFQFDATRDLLRELDVNDIVWIGLMRPQSSERFMWSNSRALAADTGYWAESLPLMDSPLCAVIDPIRDYRWHALRCGGPETASFLCEMPVPSWADACIIKEMPALTMQYMADTASIELIRNCGEEGLLRQSCRGKEDREHVVRELVCPKERYEAQRINDITSSHFKSLQIINSIPSDNNENNDIELLPLAANAAGTQSYASGGGADFIEQSQTEKNTVQKLIEQFNVDELMQADQAGNEPLSTTGFRIPGEIPKPVKKSAKKVEVMHDDYPKKDASSNYNRKSKYAVMQVQYQQQQQQQQQQKQKEEEKRLHLPLEDMMMGDQPAADSLELHSGQAEHEQPMELSHEDNEQSNEIEQPLPHIKKVLPQDLRTMPTITERTHAAEEKLKKEHEKQQKEMHKQQQTTIETTTGTTTTTTIAATTTTVAPLTTKLMPVGTTIINPVTVTTDVDNSAAAAATSLYATSNNPDINVDTTVAAATPTHTANAMPTATIGHPMHPQQPRSNVITEETQHPHMKESADNSHFIPPMLLVKSHYVPPTKYEQQQHEHQQHEHEHQQSSSAEKQEQQQSMLSVTTIDTATATAAAAIEGAAKGATSSSSSNGSGSGSNIDVVATTMKFISDENKQTTMQPLLTTMKTMDTEVAAAIENTKTNEKIVALVGSGIQKIDAATQTTKSNVEQQQQQLEITTTTEKIVMQTMKNENEKLSSTVGGVDDMTKDEVATEKAAAATTTILATKNSIKLLPAAAETTLKNAKIQQEISDIVAVEKHDALSTDAPVAATKAAAAVAAAITTTTTAATSSTATTTVAQHNATANANVAATAAATAADAMVTATTIQPPTITTTIATATSTHNFLMEETETPFKPNRRRSLTKPETASYFKKILG